MASNTTFISGSNATTASDTSFSNTSTNIVWTNTTSTGFIANGSAASDFNFNFSTDNVSNGTILSFNVTVTYTDGSTNSTLVNITVVDTVNPTVSAINTPASNANLSGNQILNATVVDNTLDTVQFNVSNTTGQQLLLTATNPSGNFWNVSLNTSTLADGSYTVSVVANDSANNVNNTVNVSVTIDNTNPTVNNSAANDTTVKQNDTITINVTVTDATAGVDTVLVGNVTRTNSTMTYIGSNVYQINVTPNNLGCNTDVVCTLTFTANDTAGNSNATHTLNITVDDTNPVATASCSPSSVNTGDKFPCTCSGSDSGSGVATSSGSSTSPDGTSTPSNTGKFTYTCNVTDNAGNSALSKAEYAVNKNGGGGGGYTSDIVASHTWTSVKAGEEKSKTFDKKGLDILEVSFTLLKDKENVKLSVKQLLIGFPSDVPEPEGTLIALLEITLTSDKISSVTSDKIFSAKIKFKVGKSWLSDNGFEKYDVVLQRYTTEWNKLKTSVLSENDDKVYFEAITPGFSYFAITAEKPVVEPTEPEEPSESEQPTEPSEPTQPEQPAEPTTPDNTLLLVVAIIVIIIIIALIAMVSRRK